MARWLLLAVTIAAIVGVAFVVLRPGTPTPPAPPTLFGDDASDTKRQIQAMKSFDAEAYARTAMDRGDFRPVLITSAWHAEFPGITCLSGRDDRRIAGFGDVIFEGYEELLALLKDAARRFNRTLTTDPRYPDKDVCFPVDQPLTMIEAIAITGEPMRRPMVVDLPTAVRARDIQGVRRWIAAGADINAIDHWGQTPLMWAMRRKDRSIAAELIAAGADIHQRELGDSALVVAIETGDATLARELLVMGTKPTPAAPAPKGWHGSSNAPILAALYQKRFDLLELLLAFEAVPLRADGQGWTEPLTQARESGCTRCIDAILEYGGAELADSGVIDVQVREDLEAETSTTLVRLARPVVDRMAFSVVARDALDAAIANDRSGAVRLLLKSAQDANLLTPDEATSLTKASALGETPAMQRVLAVAATRRRALDEAIGAGDIAAIRAAVPEGATLAQINVMTPLMSAAKTAGAPVIEALIEGGSIVDARVPDEYRNYNPRPTDGETALYFALEGANVEAVRVLLRHGADLDEQPDAWPLLQAFARLIEKADVETKRRLVDLVLEAPPAERRTARLNVMLNSAVTWARWSGTPLVDMLLQRGGDPCAKTEYYRTAIASAAGHGDFALFRRLVDHCSNWSPTSPVAREALQVALDDLLMGIDEREERTKIIRFLMAQKTALPPAPFGVGKLCDALRHRFTDVANLLIASGVDLNEINNGQTALDCVGGASKEENGRIKADLRRRGAKTAAELGHKAQEMPFPF